MPKGKAKQTKGKRKQRRQQKQKVPSVVVAKTTQQVQKATMKSSKPKTRVGLRSSDILDMHYAKCRLNPFSSGGGATVPDSSGKRVTIDHRTIQTLTIGTGGTASIWMLATLPYPAFIKSNSAYSVNGVSCVANTTGNNQDWVPFEPYVEYPNNVVGTYQSLPYSAKSARFISTACKITNVSPAQSVAGYLQATPFAFGYERQTPFKEIASTSVVIRKSSDFTTGGSYNDAAGIGVITVDDVGSPTAIGNGSVIQHSAQGMVVMPKFVRPKHDWADVFNDTPIPVSISSANYTGAAASLFMLTPSNSYSGQPMVIDNNFEGVMININGAAGNTFSFEFITCVEYLIPPNSTVARFAKEADKPSPQTVDLVSNVQQSTPVAVPLAQQASWWDRFVKVAGSIGSAVKSVPHPYANVAGGVIENLASAFSAL